MTATQIGHLASVPVRRGCWVNHSRAALRWTLYLLNLERLNPCWRVPDPSLRRAASFIKACLPIIDMLRLGKTVSYEEDYKMLSAH